MMAGSTSKCDRKHKKMIRDILSKVDSLFRDIIDVKDAQPDNVATLAEAYLFLSYVFINEDDSEGMMFAELTVARSMELLKEQEFDEKFILISVDAYYYLGFLQRKINNKELSLLAYDKAMRLYSLYIREPEKYSPPFFIASYLGLEHSNPSDLLDLKGGLILKALLKAYTSLEAYATKSREYIERIVTSQHITLAMKLNKLYVRSNIDNTHYSVWALIAGSLSQYFIMNNRFTEARDHLAVASFIAKKFYEDVYVKMDEGKYPVVKAKMQESYQEMSAGIATCWAKYGIYLLRSSQEKILQNMKDKLCTLCCLKSSSLAESAEGSDGKFSKLTFPVTEHLEEFTATITDNYPSSYTDANIIFETVMRCLNEAKMYYTPEKFLLVHISILLDISRVHKLLGFYVNKINKYKLYKQRLQILLTNLETINFMDGTAWPVLEVVNCASDMIDVQKDLRTEKRYELKIPAEEMPNKVYKNILGLCCKYGFGKISIDERFVE